MLVLLISLASFFIPFILLHAAGLVHPMLRLMLHGIMCWTVLAAKSLKDAAVKVYKPLIEDNLLGARNDVGQIVGRDTQSLNSEQISRATIETVAENTSDGVIAPMLFFALGGAPLAFLYKGINTMDSMVGYKNEKYLLFGRAAALTDDIFNFFPARLSAWFMILATWICAMDVKSALRIYIRDKNNHPSPNSAHPEAACAGALGIQLGGSSCYGGAVFHKPTIGDNTRKIQADDIKKACSLMYGTAVLFFLFSCLFRFLLYLLNGGN